MRALTDIVMGVDVRVDATGAREPPRDPLMPRPSGRMRALNDLVLGPDARVNPPARVPAAAPPAAPGPGPTARPSRRMKAVTGLAMPPPPSIALGGAPTPVSVSDSKGARSVLVVDDDDAIRRLVVRALRTEYTVFEARDGEEASQLLDVHPRVDCVVMDVMMPRLSGTDLARKMRADPVLKHVPVIFLTAKRTATEMAEGISLGARFYLSKPFSLKVLLAKVGEAMSGP